MAHGPTVIQRLAHRLIGGERAAGAPIEWAAVASLLRARGWAAKEERYRRVFDRAVREREVAAPAASVVMISWDPGPLVVQSLRFLACQRGVGLEVIFVDNGSHSPRIAEIRRHVDTYVRLGENTGAYLARNVGALLARAPVLVFLEDDGIPAPDVVARHLEMFDRYDVVSVRGVYVPKNSHNALNELQRHYYLGPRPFPMNVNLEGNASYDARTFFAAMGWDDDIVFGHGGVELSLRLLRVEPDRRKQIYAPGPVILHDYAVDDSHLRRKLERQSISTERLVAKYPDWHRDIHQWREYRGQHDALLPRRWSIERAADRLRRSGRAAYDAARHLII